jgi:hypothetical protein
MPWRHMWSGGNAPPFLTTALDGDEWPTSCSWPFTSGDPVEKRKIFCLPGIEPGPSSLSVYRCLVPWMQIVSLNNLRIVKGVWWWFSATEFCYHCDTPLLITWAIERVAGKPVTLPWKRNVSLALEESFLIAFVWFRICSYSSVQNFFLELLIGLLFI